MEDIASLVLRLEASAIGIDGLEALLLNTPTKKEIASVVAFDGDQQRLGKPEKYVLALSVVPHLKARIQAMLFKLNIDEIYTSVTKDTTKVMTACRDLKSSVKFVRLLGIVLEVGNSLNKGTSKGGAKGIQLDSLMKLTQTRTNSGQTLLEYIVVHIKTKCPELLKLHEVSVCVCVLDILKIF
mgnify:CR=1 FL=1